MHPLMEDPNKLSDEELTKKINAIYDRMAFFSRMGNTSAYQQASLIYMELVENYKERAFLAQQKYAEAAAKGDSDFSDKIDIK